MSLALKCLIAASVSLLLAACGPPGSVYVKPELQAVSPEESGTIIGTVGARLEMFSKEASPFSSNSLLFRRVGDSEGGRLSFSPPDALIGEKADFQDERFKASAFVIRLPPGDYEFFQVSFFQNGGTVQKTFTATQDFSVPFKVERGRNTYIGNLVAWGIWGRNFIGMPLPAGGYWVVENHAERDLPLVMAKDPMINADSVDVRVLQPAADVPAVKTAPLPVK